MQLDVWYELHCLNDMRKALYPERLGGLEALKVNGVIDREDSEFQHWGEESQVARSLFKLSENTTNHYIDSLRQTLMCYTDVSTTPFHVNITKAAGVFPPLATTPTCRKFGKIQQWAVDHSAGNWNLTLEADQAREIVETAGFDQSPEENIQGLWALFPGNKIFKYWREHAVSAK